MGKTEANLRKKDSRGYFVLRSVQVMAFDPQAEHFEGLPACVHEFPHLVQKHWYSFGSFVCTTFFCGHPVVD
jgi:hypothetical protein